MTHIYVSGLQGVDSLNIGQNEHNFKIKIFKCVSLNDNSKQRFVSESQTDDKPSLVQVLVPIRNQATNLTNDDKVPWHIYMSSGFNG